MGPGGRKRCLCQSDPPNISLTFLEYQAVFQTLTHYRLTDHPDLPGHGLLITGKGYPDLATRHLLSSLSLNLPEDVPILALVDGDPYGLDIVSCYKWGRAGLKRESVGGSNGGAAGLKAERLEWIGIAGRELEAFGVDRDAMLPITIQDEKKVGHISSNSGLDLIGDRRLRC